MRWSVVAALGALLLAGCSDAGADASTPDGATSTTGVLQGVVVDGAIRPLADVAILARGGGAEWNTTTGADGRFRLVGLVPGAYVVSASKPFHTPLEQAVAVRAGVDDPPLVKLQLDFIASSVPYASLYKYEGMHECGFNFVRVCSNINILTGVVLCSYDPPGLPCFSVTTDSSLFFQYIDGTPTFLQSELFWEPTSASGRALGFVIGGGNLSELQSGFASGYNFTSGESPLMLRITNHEGEGSWCYRNVDDCEIPETLNYTRIGSERALLGQVDAGPSEDLGTCGLPVRPCQVGVSVQQPFTMITTVFYGYEPPFEWRFATEGQVPPA